MWKVGPRPGYFGKKRDSKHEEFDRTYGAGNWKLAHIWAGKPIDWLVACAIYEDAYYEFFKSDPGVLDDLINRASDVYDNNVSNVASGLDYTIQENDSTHLQDIAIRRSVIRLGKTFSGDHLVEIRSKNSEGGHLSPGNVPFHMPEHIERPLLEGWWKPHSIEDFYQSNKHLLLKG